MINKGKKSDEFKSKVWRVFAGYKNIMYNIIIVVTNDLRQFENSDSLHDINNNNNMLMTS